MHARRKSYSPAPRAGRVSLLPVFFGAGLIYFAGASPAVPISFAERGNWRAPSRKTAMSSFHASLAQLSLLLLAAMTDALLF